ncbi:AAA family ATPase [Kribbella sindirgiensis]|uniref:AAA family ATPase n=1 Tax=Kribbella sindirgiensis TaxID=1124744 RepID=UPI003B505294
MSSFVCLTGEIASGKSTLARALADLCPHATLASFGDVVRAEVRRLGMPMSRQSMQDAGQTLTGGGWERFVNLLLARMAPRATLSIVDGIRHRAALDCIRDQCGDSCVLVGVRVSSAEQLRRLRLRGEDPTILRHDVESEIPLLIELADIRVSGELDARGEAQKVLSYVTARGQDA